MRTNVVVDDTLMARAMRTSGCRTKRSAIESGLRLLVQVNSQKKLRDLKGKIIWDDPTQCFQATSGSRA